ncbi:double zinc ribbon domain-containing protein [Natronolimnohabitans innermongolicus]|uniref:DZANK-type domain-containing protein n=1 Tax=Natronolimnohabitans innermongolicus JCM 12255 TaxID=1227499 RepID=L9WTP3_9EURY|nr:zinc ribbon domain-containing protein [Natronolimnohabitans innermongolicus]ELY52576.1 hypothetical protein C493_16045 [Natronolimnohabitans innermongolicus JCM 12255]
MSKITFRADDDLVGQLEALEISKSEAMREALRSYLDETASARAAERAEPTQSGAIDDLIRERVDDLLTERLRDLEYAREERTRQSKARRSGDVTITVSLEDEGRPRDETRRVDNARAERHRADGDNRHSIDPVRRSGDEHTAVRAADETATVERKTSSNGDDGDVSDTGGHTQCGLCGETVDDEHVYCPNCGEKASRRLFCECGDEVRSDWSFCPSCGRRTPAADVLGRDRPT